MSACCNGVGSNDAQPTSVKIASEVPNSLNDFISIKGVAQQVMHGQFTKAIQSLYIDRGLYTYKSR